MKIVSNSVMVTISIFIKKVKKTQMSLAFGLFNLAEYGVMVAPITLDDTV